LGSGDAATTDGHADLAMHTGQGDRSHEVAATWSGLDEAKLLQRSEGLANQRAPNTEANGQASLRGQPVSALKPARDDVVGDRLGDASGVGCVHVSVSRLVSA